MLLSWNWIHNARFLFLVLRSLNIKKNENIQLLCLKSQWKHHWVNCKMKWLSLPGSLPVYQSGHVCQGGGDLQVPLGVGDDEVVTARTARVSRALLNIQHVEVPEPQVVGEHVQLLPSQARSSLSVRRGEMRARHCCLSSHQVSGYFSSPTSLFITSLTGYLILDK